MKISSTWTIQHGLVKLGAGQRLMFGQRCSACGERGHNRAKCDVADTEQDLRL